MQLPILTSLLVAIILSDGGATQDLGKTFELNCNVYDARTTKFQWMKDGALIPHATGQTFSLSELQLSDAGRYTCFATMNNVTYNSSTDIILPSKI